MSKTYEVTLTNPSLSDVVVESAEEFHLGESGTLVVLAEGKTHVKALFGPNQWACISELAEEAAS